MTRFLDRGNAVRRRMRFRVSAVVARRAISVEVSSTTRSSRRRGASRGRLLLQVPPTEWRRTGHSRYVPEPRVRIDPNASDDTPSSRQSSLPPRLIVSAPSAMASRTSRTPIARAPVGRRRTPARSTRPRRAPPRTTARAASPTRSAPSRSPAARTPAMNVPSAVVRNDVPVRGQQRRPERLPRTRRLPRRPRCPSRGWGRARSAASASGGRPSEGNAPAGRGSGAGPAPPARWDLTTVTELDDDMNGLFSGFHVRAFLEL